MTHAFGGAIAKGHHYCIMRDPGGEDAKCCHCGDEVPYRMVLARWCPSAMEAFASEVPKVKP